MKRKTAFVQYISTIGGTLLIAAIAGLINALTKFFTMKWLRRWLGKEDAEDIVDDGKIDQSDLQPKN